MLVGALTDVAYAGAQKAKCVTQAGSEQKRGKEARVLVTGSNIPQKVAQGQRTPATHSPVVIIDRTTIERSGRHTLAGVLRYGSSVW